MEYQTSTWVAVRQFDEREIAGRVVGKQLDYRGVTYAVHLINGELVHVHEALVRESPPILVRSMPHAR